MEDPIEPKAYPKMLYLHGVASVEGHAVPHQNTAIAADEAEEADLKEQGFLEAILPEPEPEPEVLPGAVEEPELVHEPEPEPVIEEPAPVPAPKSVA